MSIKHFRSIIYQYIDFYSCFDICIQFSMLCNVKAIRTFWSSSYCINDQDGLPYQDSMISVNSYLTRLSSKLNRRNPNYLFLDYSVYRIAIYLFFLSLLGFLNSLMTYLTTLMIAMVMQCHIAAWFSVMN